MMKFSVVLAMLIQALEALEKAAVAAEAGDTFSLCFYAVGTIVMVAVSYEVSQAEFRK